MPEPLPQVFSCEFCEISKNNSLQNSYGQLPLSFSTFLKIFSVKEQFPCMAFLEKLSLKHFDKSWICPTQLAFSCSKSTIETQKQYVTPVQSQQLRSSERY